MEFEPSWAYIFVLLYAVSCCTVLVLIGTAIVGIWSRADAKRMWIRIQDDLSRKPDNADLTSIKTWMEVDKVEKAKHPGAAWAPDLDYSVNLRSTWAPNPKYRDDYVQLVDYNQLMAWHTRHEKGIPLMDVPVRLFRINYDQKNEKK